MGLEEELQAAVSRTRLRRALRERYSDLGLNVGDGDPLATVLRGAGLDYDEGEVDDLYDAMLADLREEGA